MSPGVGTGVWGCSGGLGAVGRGETFCFAPLARSISQNSSILPEEEDEKSCTESELRVARRRSPARHEEVSTVQNLLVKS